VTEEVGHDVVADDLAQWLPVAARRHGYITSRSSSLRPARSIDVGPDLASVVEKRRQVADADVAGLFGVWPVPCRARAG
jgi:hypothetical protein